MEVIFVDDMYRYPLGRFRRMKMSHLVTDQPTDDELHHFAWRLGLKREWYQGDHYDISMTKRIEALRLGATPVTMIKLGRILLRKRAAAAKARGNGR